MNPGEYGSTNYQTNKYTLRGLLPAVLRELADAIEQDQTEGWEHTRIDVKPLQSAYDLIQGYAVRVDRMQATNRHPAGYGPACPACHAQGHVSHWEYKQNPDQFPYDEDRDCYRCVTCGGTGYLLPGDDNAPCPGCGKPRCDGCPCAECEGAAYAALAAMENAATIDDEIEF